MVVTENKKLNQNMLKDRVSCTFRFRTHSILGRSAIQVGKALYTGD